jgi:hypothetical protein
MAKATYVKQLVVKDANGKIVAIDMPGEYVFSSDGKTLDAHVIDSTIHFTEAQIALLASPNSANGVLQLTSQNKIPSQYIGSTGGIKSDTVYASIATRDAAGTGSLPIGAVCFVTDASADSTVDSGWAMYRWSGTAWTKIYEGESIDASRWNGSWETLIGKPSSLASEIDAMVALFTNPPHVVTLTTDPATDIVGY